MHALKEFSLAETASTVFNFSAAETHIENIRKGETPSEKQKASMRLYMSQTELPQILREELRTHLVEWHRNYLPAADHFHEATYILRSMNQCLSAIGCEPFPESGKEHLKADRSALHEALLERTVKEITHSKSGCLMDMALRIYNSSLCQLGLRKSDEAKAALSDAVEARCADFPEWKESCYQAIGISRREDAVKPHTPNLS